MNVGILNKFSIIAEEKKKNVKIFALLIFLNIVEYMYIAFFSSDNFIWYWSIYLIDALGSMIPVWSPNIITKYMTT